MTNATPELVITLGAFALATFCVLLFDVGDRLPQFRTIAVLGLTLLSCGLLLEITASVLVGKLWRRP